MRVAVIGGGIVGVSTAEWLRRQGAAVTLIDRGKADAAASFGNGGVLARCAVVPVPVPGILAKAPGMLFNKDKPLFLRWSHLPRMFPWLTSYLSTAKAEKVREIAAGLAPLLLDTVEQHQALAKGTPAERWIVPSDYLYIYPDRKSFEGDGFGWALRRDHGIVGDELDADALRDYDPQIGSSSGYAYRMTDHGHITNPGQYVADLTTWFEGQGGKRIEGDVQAIDSDSDGARVIYQGGTVEADNVAICCGIWSKKLAETLGHKVKIESERGYHMVFENPSHKPPAPYMVADGKFVATPMDGVLRIAGVVEFGGTEKPPSKGPIGLLERGIERLYPGFTASSRRSWMGHRPSTSDSLPVLGGSSKHPRVFFGFGHHHVGLTSGPKSGRLLADIILGGRPNIDVGCYRIERFA
ncbi:MAG: FAD-binding oxidoreductase [Pseudomonadota bacterium]